MPIEIPKCSSPEGYEQYARNVEAQKVADWEEKAREAHRAAVRMRAEQRGAKTEAERECLQAIFAYEWTLFKKHGRRQSASYTWRAVRDHGIIAAVEKTVTKKKETAGYRALEAEGMLDMAFEAVVLTHPELFSADAVKMSQERMAQWQADKG